MTDHLTQSPAQEADPHNGPKAGPEGGPKDGTMPPAAIPQPDGA